ncbi:3933_t:CDS:2 [Paraglomus brasilianum]|uniref:3933_t:CDS:1 n=1 Tax=Paraglomus brasilianum TaxID=144538 RepID=A0A9N9AYH4_9GLOM|nr:3933_t:CDS:2 [Paraglomus brasilianum]
MADAHTTLRHRNSCVSTHSSNSDLGNGDALDANKESQQGVIGKTFEGGVFIVPQTKDMLTSVFDPSTRKSLFDILTLSVMALQIILFLFLPTSISRWLFLDLFIFFRLAYNCGLGLLLKMQSDKKVLVNWAKKKKLFEKKGGKLPEFFKRELSAKMGDDYDFEVSWLGLYLEKGEGEFIRDEPFGIFIIR